MTDETAAEIGTFVTDADLVVRGWNAQLSHMTGIREDEALGQPLTAVVPDLEARGLLEMCERVLRSGAVEVLAPAVHQGLVPCPPAMPSPVFDRMQQRTTIGPLRDDERIVGLVFTIEDVTRRREHERALAADLRNADPAVRVRAMQRLAEDDGLAPDEALASGVRDDDWRVRRAALGAVSERRHHAMLASVLAALPHEHRNFNVISSALSLLALDDIDVVRPLLELLHAPDTNVRIQAALALGARRDPEATAALLRALDDPDGNVRFHAIESLGRLGVHEATERLVTIAESRDFFLAFPALDALARIGDPRIAPRLVPLVADPGLAGAAAEALAHVGDEDTAPILIAALHGPLVPAEFAARALSRLHERLEASRPGAGDIVPSLLRRSTTPTLIERLLDAAGGVGPEAPALAFVLGATRDAAVVPGLIRLLQSPEARGVALDMLVGIGSPAVDALIARLEDDEAEIRRAAVAALERVRDRRATSALIGRLADDPDLVPDIASAVGTLGGVGALEALVELLAHEEAAVRQAATKALARLEHPDMPAQIAALLADSQPHVREAGVRLAASFGYPELRGAVFLGCRDDHEDVRRAAIECLPRLEDERTSACLLRALAGDTPRVRAAAVRGLAEIADAEALPALLGALADPDPWVRYFAADGLGRRGDVDAREALTRLVQTDPAVQVRIAAVEALGVLGKPDGVPALSRVLESNERDLRRAALRALAMTDDPDAHGLLQSARQAADPDRRIDAVDAIADAAGPGAAEWLQQAAERDQDARVASAAVAGLARLADEGTAAEGEQAFRALVVLAAMPPGGSHSAIAELAAGVLRDLGAEKASAC